MFAAIDAGSNTLRLLIGQVLSGKVVPMLYQRRISRLAGGFSEEMGLSLAARERTLRVFQEFAATCRSSGVSQIKAVATAAFRQAVNGEDFADEVRKASHLPLTIINGDMEADYMAAGVLSVLEPMPQQSLIIDIGGGSTEFVLCSQRKVVWSCSLPLGVVLLTEGFLSFEQRYRFISSALAGLVAELAETCKVTGIDASKLTLVGTAGTVTTLAALDMQLKDYSWERVNNYILPQSRLQFWQSRLSSLSLMEREALPGMEKGRGDLIGSGLDILLYLLQTMNLDSLTVSDFGLLEGVLLSMQKERKT